MSKIKPFTVTVGLIVVTIILFGFWLFYDELGKYFAGRVSREQVLSFAGYTFQGVILFGALYLYLPSKVTIETISQASANALFANATEMLQRADKATFALKHLEAVASSNPRDLPTACTAEFSDVASFCAGWSTPERRYYWDESLTAKFVAATAASFDFLLTLEIIERPNSEILRKNLERATTCLAQVIKKLRIVLGIRTGD